MNQEQKALQLAATLRKCADRGGCMRCPLDNYVGCCTDKLKQESAEMIEDQQAIIRSLAAKVSGMVAAIEMLKNKYSGEASHGPKKADR